MESQEGNATNIHTTMVSFCICIGFGFNIMFLMSLKADKKKLNNNEKIQVYKTFLLISAMILYIPFELWVMQTARIDNIICAVKDTLQTLFLDSYPIATTVVAIMRFRLTICPNKIEILVRKSYCIAMIISCSVLPISVAVSRVVVSSLLPNATNNINFTYSVDVNDCYQINPTEINYFNMGSSILIYGVPLLLVIILYSGIMYIASASFNRVQQNCVNSNPCRQSGVYGSKCSNASHNASHNIAEHKSRGARIRKSVSTLIGFFLLVTIPIGTIQMYLNAMKPNGNLNVILIYLKTLQCIVHAFGEGVLFLEKRQKSKLFFDKFLNPFKQRTMITGRALHNNCKVVVIDPTDSVEVVNNLSSANNVPIPNTCSRDGCSSNVLELKDYTDRRNSSPRSLSTSKHLERDNELTLDSRHLNVCSSAEGYTTFIKTTSTNTLMHNNAFDFKISKSTSIHSNLTERTTQFYYDPPCDSPLSDSVLFPTETVNEFVYPTETLNTYPRPRLVSCNTMSQNSPSFELFETKEELTPENSPQTVLIRDSIRTLSVLSDTL